MFTIEQINAAHAKVKSGADFPSYIKDIKTLGVTSYILFVSDGHIDYNGANEFKISSDVTWATLEIAPTSSIEKLNTALKIHQKGQTDYLTFCKQSADAGVEKWIVDMEHMLCTYYDLANNNMITETIPTV